MAEESFMKRNWMNISIFILILAIIIFKFLQPAPQPIIITDNYTEPYCVEWDNTIPRENIILLCYDFKTLKPTCDWNVYPDGTLELTEYTNHSNVYAQYQCTRYVKSRIVQIKPIPIQIIQEPTTPDNRTDL